MSWRRLVLGVALACILVATLTPAGTALQPEFTGCIVCGTRGYADAVVNLILFAPLGAALALNGRTGWRPVLLVGALSCGVEFTQIAIPGRDPSLGDVCFNTFGAAAGQLGFHLGARWLVPTHRAAARLSAGASLVALIVFAGTGYLLAPSFPRRPFYSWWTADRAELAWYHGRVLQATLGPISLRPGDRPLPSDVRQLLSAGAPLRLRAIAGPRTSSLGPLLVIEDGWGQEVLLIGPDREDLVLRYRARSSLLRLDHPDLRLENAFAGIVPGDTLRIDARREPDGYCLELNHASACHVWFTVGSAWALLLYPRHLPPWGRRLLGAAWVAGLLLPVGLWWRSRPVSVLALGVVLAGLSILPGYVGLNSTPVGEWVGAAAGLLMGLAMKAVAARSRSRVQPPG